jgi:hypothetical protein
MEFHPDLSQEILYLLKLYISRDISEKIGFSSPVVVVVCGLEGAACVPEVHIGMCAREESCQYAC